MYETRGFNDIKSIYHIYITYIYITIDTKTDVVPIRYYKV